MGFCPSGLLSQWAFVRSPNEPRRSPQVQLSNSVPLTLCRDSLYEYAIGLSSVVYILQRKRDQNEPGHEISSNLTFWQV